MDNNNAFQLSFDEQHYAWLAIDVPAKNEYPASGICRRDASRFATLNESEDRSKD